MTSQICASCGHAEGDHIRWRGHHVGCMVEDAQGWMCGCQDFRPARVFRTLEPADVLERRAHEQEADEEQEE